MCGRFTLTADLQKIAERFGVPTASPDAYTAARTDEGRQREGEHASQRRGYSGGEELGGRRPPLQGNTPTERRGYTGNGAARPAVAPYRG